MKKIKELPVQERPREKLLARGAAVLSDLELLAIILGKGSSKIDVLALAERLLRTVDAKGLGLQARDLLASDGVGAAKATVIAAAFEFVRRRIRPEGLKIKFPADILPLIQHYNTRKQEHFICISVNGANEVISVRVVTIGLINKSQVHPRELFADVIVERASAVIIAHNHPSGNVEPSSEDLLVTKRIKEAAAILGINLLDHIIFSPRGYYSFAEHNGL
jgi:DNA repair protein RadC